MWHEEDLRPGGAEGMGGAIGGLQFWNGHTGTDFRAGREFWVRQLLAGRRLFPIGANDAHGNLNRNIGVKTPLFSLYENRKHVFGNVRTVVWAARKSLEGIQEGLRQGPVVCTDGPFVNLGLEEGILLVAARSSRDFGALEKIALFSGKKGETGENLVKEWNLDKGPMDFSEFTEPPTGVAYLRAEARTAGKRFAMTSPLFLTPG